VRVDMINQIQTQYIYRVTLSDVMTDEG